MFNTKRNTFSTKNKSILIDSSSFCTDYGNVVAEIRIYLK